MTVKKLVGKLHLWLGLMSGLVVFIISITGCIYAFQAELQDLLQPFRFVEQQQTPYLPPSRLQAQAEKALPDKLVHSVLYAEPGRAAEVLFYSHDPHYYYSVFMNPYTAEVLKVHDINNSFFGLVLEGHFYLWLPHEVGQPLVASATLIFVVMLISGIILWWPRNKNGTRQRFTIKWNGRWRRKNYDLHNVLGFYVSGIALLLALTGLIWGFQWFAAGVYGLASGGRELKPYQEPVSDTTLMAGKAADMPAIDKIWYNMRAQHPKAAVLEIHTPLSPSSSILAAINPNSDTYWKMDYRYFDQYSLKELSVDHVWNRFHKLSGADKLMRMNYDIHTGGILGLPGKIIMFLASLLCASLPVTGICIWWGRKNKKALKADKPDRKTKRALAKV
ncbi:PepSY domain-containing protein [Cesiribacter sp. SM1]|uniref:PepSY-associated TM helix domain-containing protein n=1 Tax=Cesiribacter sp. SM1 TaxID=2861196 RepID=UPI001CD3E24F|nr:PepSY-associated TM helix domain-containing protein [Cesiribacter sp. SM1]